jgi:hypothetical protein
MAGTKCLLIKLNPLSPSTNCSKANTTNSRTTTSALPLKLPSIIWSLPSKTLEIKLEQSFIKQQVHLSKPGTRFNYWQASLRCGLSSRLRLTMGKWSSPLNPTPLRSLRSSCYSASPIPMKQPQTGWRKWERVRESPSCWRVSPPTSQWLALKFVALAIPLI